MILALIALLALTRAEILERFRAPVITQADGFIKVFADCPEDMRREFQSPIARFAADTVTTLRQARAEKAPRYASPGLVIHVGDVRTNLTDVVTKVETNGTVVLTRIFVKSPGFADLRRFKLEIIKAFERAVAGRELDDDGAIDAYRAADPRLRIEDLRIKLERWIRFGEGDDEEGLELMRRIIEPGVASRRDVLTFASRLFLYPPQDDLRILGKYRSLSFREALELGWNDPGVRVLAALKAPDLPVFGGGRGKLLSAAAFKYMEFLQTLARGDSDREKLTDLLDEADSLLNQAMQEARMREEGNN